MVQDLINAVFKAKIVCKCFQKIHVLSTRTPLKKKILVSDFVFGYRRSGKIIVRMMEVEYAMELKRNV